MSTTASPLSSNYVMNTRSITGERSSQSRHEFTSLRLDQMVEEGLHAFNKLRGMRQGRVGIERLFVFPARVNVENSGITDGAECVNVETTGFFSGGNDDLAQRLFDYTDARGPRELVQEFGQGERPVRPRGAPGSSGGGWP